MGDQGFRERHHDRRVVVLLLLGLTVLFGGLYVAGYYFTSDKVPRGTAVAGVRIGGLQPAEAERRLVRSLDERLREPITVSADGRRTTIDPRQAGLRLDAEDSVAQAGGGRSWMPGRVWDFFTGGDSYEPVIEVDDADLERALASIAGKVDRPAVDGAVSFRNGRPGAVPAERGQEVDQDAAEAAVVAAFLGGIAAAGGEGAGAVQLPVRDVEPEITDDEVREVMDSFANPAMSAPVVIELDDETVELPPQAYAGALSVQKQGGELTPVLDEKALMRGIRPALRKVTVAPREATVELVRGEPRVVPGRTGVTFERETITGEFLSLVAGEGDARTLELDGVKDRPGFTTADARKLRIKRVVSSFTTYYPHADYRNTNLGRAAELVTGTVLRPGETFSLNDTVGERTAANGFAKGFIISDGIYEEDYGGGVSQVATTLFNAAFFAGLEDVEHEPHSFYIDRYPIGREATVAWGAIDLRFKNDTPYGVLIQAGVDPSTPSTQGAMTVKMWSTKHWDIEAGVSERHNFTEEETRYIDDENCTPNDGYGGFDIDVYRFFREPGSEEVVRRETISTTYTPSDTVICQ